MRIIVAPLWLLACLCLLLMLWSGTPAGAQITSASQPTQALSRSDIPHVPPQAIAYQHTERLLALGSFFWSWLVLWLLLQTGLSARLRSAIYRLTRRTEPEGERPPPFRVLFLYYLGFTLIWMASQLPFDLAFLFAEHRYGFSHQSVLGLLQDMALENGLNLFMTLPFWGAFWLYTRSPRRWWLWAWGAFVPLAFFFMIVQPVVIAPLYNHYTPLPPGRTRDDLLRLAAKAGITGANVLVEDTSKRTSHVNAYVTGIGPSTRIVLNDTALHTLTEDQLLAIMGHEMGHYVEGHIWLATLEAIGIAFVFFGLLSRLLPWLLQRTQRVWRLHGITDPAAIPMLLLILALFMFLIDPIVNGASRLIEHRADAFGLRLTHLNEPMIQAFVGFAERDYSDPDPPWLWHFWFGTHPTLNERIAFARSYRPKE